jgi:hypothetical protein
MQCTIFDCFVNVEKVQIIEKEKKEKVLISIEQSINKYSILNLF